MPPENREHIYKGFIKTKRKEIGIENMEAKKKETCCPLEFSDELSFAPNFIVYLRKRNHLIALKLEHMKRNEREKKKSQSNIRRMLIYIYTYKRRIK